MMYWLELCIFNTLLSC